MKKDPARIPAKHRIKMEKLARIIEDHFNLDNGEIFSDTRKRSIVYPRDIYHYFLVEKIGFSYYKAGCLTKRDHASVLFGVKKIKSFMEIGDKEITYHVNKLTLKVFEVHAYERLLELVDLIPQDKLDEATKKLEELVA